MTGHNYLVPTQVQNGETLSLYANMYGCSVDDIKKVNSLKGDKLKEGQTINVPVGKKWKLPTSDDNVLDKKLSWFNDQVNDVHMKLYEPNLKPAEREKLEGQYIKLMNMKKERDAVATFKKAGNGINLVLEVKKEISVAEFRKLFPECTRNFYDYACDTNQRYCDDEQHTWVADPNSVYLEKGAKIMVRADEYAKDEGDTGWSGFCRSWKKTMPSWLGGGRLDGK